MSGDSEAVVRSARMRVAGLVAGTLLISAFAESVPPAPPVDRLVLPAALLGAVAPVIAYRLYLWFRESPNGPTDTTGRQAAFVRAVTLAVAAAAGAALFGVGVFALTRQPWPLIGLFGLVLSAGALWPTPEKLEMFLEAAAEHGDAG